MSQARTLEKIALPDQLALLADARISACFESARVDGLDLPEAGLWPGDAKRVFACSEFVSSSCEQSPAMLKSMLESGKLAQAHGDEGFDRVGHYRFLIDDELDAADDQATLIPALRRLRREEWVRIAWRDIGGLADLDESVGDASAFAEAAIQSALGRLHQRQCAEVGTPENAKGEPQALAVFALGKLGAGELNFSSDIDLIFAFPESGETRGKRRALSNDEYFQRLAKQLIKVLGERTSDGFVFRVDMRLRPFGASGPLVMSFNALEDYYQVHGRGWERYALIRARRVAGDGGSADALLERLRPFVYRRYLDFGALESIRDMKTMISKEMARKGLENDLKLGHGGIREIEFIGQAFQMVRGGRIPELRDRQILRVLKRLGQRGLLPNFAVDGLIAAYRFLRNSEHRLQQIRDRQRHVLPKDDFERMILAAGMGYPDWPSYARALERHQAHVKAQFEQVLGSEDDGGRSDEGRDHLLALLGDRLEDEAAVEILRSADFVNAESALEYIKKFRSSYSVRMLDAPGRSRLRRLFPDLLRAVAGQRDPVETLGRILEALEPVVRRSAYLALLSERPLALSQLVRLCAASPRISRQLGRHPLLFDELLDARTLYAPLKREALESELAERLSAVTPGDTEQEMACLRQFKHANVLRVAAADIADVIPLMVVSDYLTEIAETTVRKALELAKRDVIARYGEPLTTQRDPQRAVPFAIIAYGKLGGIELGYGSDLDLVFIHGEGGAGGQTSGERSVDNSVFFGRLAQRTIHFLSAVTPDGTLYEIDSRLRPDGSKGILVNAIDSLE
ncbi:MAG: bifunctional [glutamate--ammonia ligase]-adenylyl-L-tyrosine phosphorylase/[glutamate--ammonia-ligase] adenylyltransferase, partial [Gammaproteobacteria bacterium]|nr:bifunctional [glutamate--ammonia ligase]-adenylyl-L-tyrosine phosphorylase/[glutamate--ammonia-ligase] adenylyltransferase [Gammaproteobacteria bacterium]